jgi:hypothetical protein
VAVAPPSWRAPWLKPRWGYDPVASGFQASSGPQVVNPGGQPQFPGFTPYKPPSPPTGSYDPALDAQLRASQRGLGDVRADTATANLRGLNDFTTASAGIDRDKARGYADIDRQLGDLSRSYQQLARRQAEGARAAGVLSGGIALQAAAKRLENERLDQRPLWTAKTRLGEDAALAQAALKLDYDRGLEDRTTALTRAEREGTAFGLDTDEVKGFQATQSGWKPKGRPKNQGVNKKGVPYKEVRQNGFIYRIDQNGKVLSKRRAKGKGNG